MINKIIRSRDYMNFDAIGKECELFYLFHSSGFSSLKPEQRLTLLQELENIEAKKQNRKPYKVVSDNKDERLMNAGIIFGKNGKPGKILFNEKYIFEGKEKTYNPITREKTYEEVEGLNIRLLDSMLHEQFHALFHHLICGLNQGEGELYRELKEYKTYFDCHEVTERQQQADIRKEFYLYITNPDEYYAFEYAYENTLNIFRYINGRYGFDDSIGSYKDYQICTRRMAEQSFLHDTGVVSNYEEIYKILLNNWALKYAQQNGYTVNSVMHDISNSKKLLDHYHVF